MLPPFGIVPRGMNIDGAGQGKTVQCSTCAAQLEYGTVSSHSPNEY